MQRKKQRQAVDWVAAGAPIGLALLSIYWLGWPASFPVPTVYIVCLSWFILTVFVGYTMEKRVLPPEQLAIVTGMFRGTAMATFILVLVFLVPSVSGACGNAHYDYHLPVVNALVHRLAARMGADSC